ncbi:hypothetical protein BJ742DRAFT_743896 [Cladochytrium replicatum]|nr:hypothetical protein BJ742DRAFT_743896 [Cladochytrium replicatum]
MSVAALRFLAVSATVLLVNAQLPMPPPAPAAYPSDDQQLYIGGAFLQDPLVTTAVAHVRAVVPAALLNIRTSTQRTFGDVIYNDNAEANCYWGATAQCKRAVDTANFKADISVCPQAGQWGITFDDGPISQPGGLGAADLRRNLAAAGVKATMFVAGSQCQTNPTELLGHYQAGHEIAVHTWTHHPCTNLTLEQLVAEVKYTERKIFEITGKVPQFFRPPYGDMDDRVRAILNALGYRIIHWSLDSQDTTATAATIANITANVASWATLPGSTPGFITLNHEISTQTLTFDAAMLAAVAARRAAGTLAVQPQPVGQCLGINAYREIAGQTPATTGAPSRTAAATASATAKVTQTSNAAAPGLTPRSVADASWFVAILAVVFVANVFAL